MARPSLQRASPLLANCEFGFLPVLPAVNPTNLVTIGLDGKARNRALP